MKNRNASKSTIAILIGTAIIFTGLMIISSGEKIWASSSIKEFIADYGGYGIKGEWETLGTASANMIFENEGGSGWIMLGENKYLVEVLKKYIIEQEEETSIIYEGNLIGNEGIVRFALYKDVMVGEIEVEGLIYSFGVAQTLDSARHVLDQYNEHLQEEIEPPPFEDLIVPDDKLVIPATIDIDPDTLNLKSKGKWVTAYIELPVHPELPEFDVTQIDLNTVKLNEQIFAENDPKYGFVKDPDSYLVDHDEDGLLERLVKFDRVTVQDILESGDRVKIEITGLLIDGRPFYGLDWIRVIGEKDLKDSASSTPDFTLDTVYSATDIEETDNTECTECSAGEMGTLSEQEARPKIDSDSSLYQRFILTLPGGYIAEGVGMRNRGYGDITISGIPSGSTIEKVYLYWDILDNSEKAEFKNGKFNGVPITGIKIGEGSDPCWAPTKNFAYRADVTNLVIGNGTYSLTDFASGRRDGHDPWVDQYPFPQIEGASLVVIYRNPALPWQTIVIYDGAETLIASEYTHTINSFKASSPVTSAFITYIGGDGQDGVNYAAEDTYFNEVKIGDYDWDGSEPQAGPNYSRGNLWDTNTYDVTSLVNPGDTSATAKVRSYFGRYGYADCLVWVATVFSVSTVSPEREVSVLAVADEEYIDYYDNWWNPWDEDQWISEMIKAVELGDDAFEREFQINFVVKDIDFWDSDDATDDLWELFKEVRREMDKGINDVMVAFTNQNIEGNIRESLFWGPYTGGILGLAEGLGDDIIVVLVKNEYIDNLHQHEYSHLFGAPDHGDVKEIRCIMSYAWAMKINDWCSDCYSTISANKWREF